MIIRNLENLKPQIFNIWSVTYFLSAGFLFLLPTLCNYSPSFLSMIMSAQAAGDSLYMRMDRPRHRTSRRSHWCRRSADRRSAPTSHRPLHRPPLLLQSLFHANPLETRLCPAEQKLFTYLIMKKEKIGRHEIRTMMMMRSEK